MLGSARGWILGLLVCTAVGCTLSRGIATPQNVDGAIEMRDASVPPGDSGNGDRDDAGTDDAGGEDAFTPIDAGCTTAPFCDGTTLVSCEGRTDCAAGGRICRDGACAAACDPGATRCTGGVEERCDDGRWETSTTCPLGCGATACNPVPTCSAYTAAGSLVVGSATSTIDIDLCDGAGVSDVSVGNGDCDDANGNEVMFTLDVPTAQMVTIDERDHDSDDAVDTVLYVRSACGDMGTELACDDDQPCDTSDGVDDACAVRSDGRLARFGHSRISRMFEPGRYFVFIDSLRSSDCGTVRVYATSP